MTDVYIYVVRYRVYILYIFYIRLKLPVHQLFALETNEKLRRGIDGAFAKLVELDVHF